MPCIEHAMHVFACTFLSVYTFCSCVLCALMTSYIFSPCHKIIHLSVYSTCSSNLSFVSVSIWHGLIPVKALFILSDRRSFYRCLICVLPLLFVQTRHQFATSRLSILIYTSQFWIRTCSTKTLCSHQSSDVSGYNSRLRTPLTKPALSQFH